jgi:hypothetical protein
MGLPSLLMGTTVPRPDRGHLTVSALDDLVRGLLLSY